MLVRNKKISVLLMLVMVMNLLLPIIGTGGIVSYATKTDIPKEKAVEDSPKEPIEIPESKAENNIDNEAEKPIGESESTNSTESEEESVSMEKESVNTEPDSSSEEKKSVNTEPEVTNISSPNEDGEYGKDDIISIEVMFSEDVNVTGTPKLELNSGSNAIYEESLESNKLLFSYVIQCGDKTDNLSVDSIDITNGSITSPEGSSALLTLPSGKNLNDNNNISIVIESETELEKEALAPAPVNEPTPEPKVEESIIESKPKVDEPLLMESAELQLLDPPIGMYGAKAFTNVDYSTKSLSFEFKNTDISKGNQIYIIDSVRVSDGYVAIGKYFDGCWISFLIKYNNDGDEIWRKISEPSTHYNGIVYTDDHFYVAGKSYDNNSHFGSDRYGDAILIKFDEDGNEVSFKNFKLSSSANDDFQFIKLSSDNKLIIQGFIDTSNDASYVWKYELDGTKIWENKCSESNYVHPGSIDTDSSGNILSVYTIGGSTDKVAVRLIDNNGNTIWTKYIQSEKINWGFRSLVTNDNNYIVGYMTRDNSDNRILGLSGYNLSGDVLWDYKTECKGDIDFRGVIQLDSGDYLCAGSKNLFIISNDGSSELWTTSTTFSSNNIKLLSDDILVLGTEDKKGLFGRVVFATGASSVTSSIEGNFKTGQKLDINVIFPSNTTVTGNPTLKLNSDGEALYKEGSGTSSITFEYTIGSNDFSAKLDATELNFDSGSITIDGSQVSKSVPQGDTTGSLKKDKDISINSMDGAGTEIDPYLVESQRQFMTIKDNNSAYYKLANGITITYDSFPMNFDFAGTFDGDGHTVTFNNTVTNSYNVGMFRVIEETGTVMNLQMVADIVGSNDLGTIAHANKGTIENVKVILKRFQQTNIHNGSSYTGGIVGNNSGTIRKCGVVPGDGFIGIIASNRVGGIVGSNSESGIIDQCFFTASFKDAPYLEYIGGIVGMSYGGSVTRCFVKTDADLPNANGFGGILGDSQSNTIAIEECYFEGNIKSEPYASGISRDGYLKHIKNCYSKGTFTSIRDGSELDSYAIAGGGAPVINCYSNATAKKFATNSPQSSYKTNSIGDATGIVVTESELKDKSTYGGWDFENIWAIDETGTINGGYPYLRNVASEDMLDFSNKPSEPNISNITSSNDNNTYRKDDVVSIQVTFSENIIVNGSPKLNLDSKGEAIYSSGFGTNTLTFNYTVKDGESSKDLNVTAINLNGGAIKNGSDVNAKLDLPTKNLADNKDIVINTTTKDTVKPTISLNGDATITINVGDTYNEQGATATDNVDGDITSSIVITGSVDTSKEGTYTITYTVTDKAGNTATIIRTVIVKKKDSTPEDNEKPTKPSVNVEDGQVIYNNITIVINNGTDSGSGVSHTEYNINGSGWIKYEGQFTISTDGVYTIEIRTVDKAGNVSITIKVTITVAKDALKEAQEAVNHAKETKDQSDIDKAKDLVDALPDSPEKDKLLDELNKITPNSGGDSGDSGSTGGGSSHHKDKDKNKDKDTNTGTTTDDNDSEETTNPITDKDKEKAEDSLDDVVVESSNDTDSPNSGAGSIDIDLGDEVGDVVDELQDIIEDSDSDTETGAGSKDSSSSGNQIDIVIEVSDKDGVVYKDTVNSTDKIHVDDLKDNTNYSIDVSILYGSNIIAHKVLNVKTTDKTSPILRKIQFHEQTIVVEALDNLQLHTYPYQYKVQDEFAYKPTNLDYLVSLKPIANENKWVDNNTIFLTKGDKIDIKVRDMLNNYSDNSYEFTGQRYSIETVNPYDPLMIRPNDKISVDSIFRDVLTKHNSYIKEPSDRTDVKSEKLSDYTISIDNEDIVSINDYILFAESLGDCNLTFVNKETKDSMIYGIEVSDVFKFDRSYVTFSGKPVDLVEVFSYPILREFGDFDNIKIVNEEGDRVIRYTTISSGLTELTMKKDNREIKIYTLGRSGGSSDVPEVNTLYINCNRVVKNNETLTVDGIFKEYDVNSKLVNSNNIILENLSPNVLEIYGDKIGLKEKGYAKLNIVDVETGVFRQLGFKVENFKRSNKKLIDIDNHWSKSYVDSLLSTGLCEGYEDLTFRPDKKVSREEFFTFLARVKAYVSDNSYNQRQYISVNEERWSIPYILESINNIPYSKISPMLNNGYDFTKDITREEVAFYLSYNVSNNSTKEAIKFDDVDNSKYKEAIDKVGACGLMSGNKGHFRPNDTLTRGEIATICYRLLNLNKKVQNR